jgi:exportin-1
MYLPNQVWDDIINQATKNVDVLKDPDAVKQLGNILKTNVRACKALGHPYMAQLGRIYLDMLNVYKVMSENISAAIALNGEAVTKQPLIRSMRTVKKETLKLITGWVSRSNDPQLVLENFIPPLLDAVLLDYQRCSVPSAREPEVLSTMATIVSKLEVNFFLTFYSAFISFSFCDFFNDFKIKFNSNCNAIQLILNSLSFIIRILFFCIIALLICLKNAMFCQKPNHCF